MNTAVDKLRNIAKEFSPEVIALAEVVLGNPDFGTWTGSGGEGQHHYGTGQLAQHTLEVVDLCLVTNDYYHSLGKGVPKDLLYLAALFHDLGKLTDYELKEGVWTSAEDKYKVHHISRSAIAWSKHTDDLTWLTKEQKDEVLHAILAHHGRREWGSPVEPRTRMAWLLHLSDNMSAKIYTPCFSAKK